MQADSEVLGHASIHSDLPSGADSAHLVVLVQFRVQTEFRG